MPNDIYLALDFSGIRVCKYLASLDNTKVVIPTYTTLQCSTSYHLVRAPNLCQSDTWTVYLTVTLSCISLMTMMADNSHFVLNEALLLKKFFFKSPIGSELLRSRKELHQTLKTESQTQVSLEPYPLFNKYSCQPANLYQEQRSSMWSVDQNPDGLIKIVTAGSG